MRDKERIDKFCKEFSELWKKYPDLRFGQIICDLQEFNKNDLFYIEDDHFMNKLKEMFKNI